MIDGKKVQWALNFIGTISHQLILQKQLITNQLRVYHDKPYSKKLNKYVIKISGIWETNNKIGLTYKIMEL